MKMLFILAPEEFLDQELGDKSPVEIIKLMYKLWFTGYRWKYHGNILKDFLVNIFPLIWLDTITNVEAKKVIVMILFC